MTDLIPPLVSILIQIAACAFAIIRGSILDNKYLIVGGIICIAFNIRAAEIIIRLMT